MIFLKKKKSHSQTGGRGGGPPFGKNSRFFFGSVPNHTGRIYLINLHYVFSNAFSNCLHPQMHSRIGCICLSFLHCVFSNVTSKCLPGRMHNHIGCICLAFPHCVFSNVSSKCLPEKRHSCIGCMEDYKAARYIRLKNRQKCWCRIFKNVDAESSKMLLRWSMKIHTRGHFRNPEKVFLNQPLRCILHVARINPITDMNFAFVFKINLFLSI